MTYKKLFACFLFCLFLSNAKAQIENGSIGYYNDAIRFSQLSFGGTSRFLGLAGATSALGGDMGNVSGNPAGLGFFRKSEFSITPAFNFAGTNTSYLGNSTRDNRQGFNISNFGLVISGAKDDLEPGFGRGGSFGISFTRKNNFQNQFSYSGTNSNNSLTDDLVENVQGVPANELFPISMSSEEMTSLEQLAFYTFLIDTMDNGPGNDDEYFSYINGSRVKQEEQVVTRGGQNEWNLSYGANLNDVIYLGAGIGIPTIKYLSSKVYKETVLDNSPISNYTLNSTLDIRGTGINVKLGGIVRPADWVRFGFSLQSPSFYSMREEYTSDIIVKYSDVNFIGQTEEEAQTVPGTYSYNLTTPARIKGGVALFSGKAGFISADVEYVAYNNSRFTTSNGAVFSSDNKTIKSIYKPAVNFSIGGEIRKDIYRFRGGFNVLGDAYRTSENINRNIYNATVGAGLRLTDYYLDFALVNTRSNGIYNPYVLNDGTGPSAAIKNRNTSFNFSVGTFF